MDKSYLRCIDPTPSLTLNLVYLCEFRPGSCFLVNNSLVLKRRFAPVNNVWTTANGRRIHIRDMDSYHLQNTIGMLKRWNGRRRNPGTIDYFLPRMLNELNRRRRRRNKVNKIQKNYVV